MRMLIACILFLNAFTKKVNEHAEATEENLYQKFLTQLQTFERRVKK